VSDLDGGDRVVGDTVVDRPRGRAQVLGDVLDTPR